jgi:tetratricopeptide (TPR) repeat protein/DNA-binding XRE family transcriptional regulator
MRFTTTTELSMADTTLPGGAKLSRPRTGGMQLGERLRRLRVSAGLTQSELAGERFSKEYVSQIERGKTRPTQETIEWLSARLGVDPGFLATGVSAEEQGRVEAALARAEALSQAHRPEDAIREFESIRSAVSATGAVELAFRSLTGQAWAYMQAGRTREAVDLLVNARSLSERPEFSDLDRGNVLFRLGVCRYKLSSISTALGLFTEALTLAERSQLPSDQLRSEILGWRSRCYRRQRDLEAAREDVERALELARALGDRRSLANTYFQASLVAERLGHWLQARTYAEHAKALYVELEDELNVGRLLNNLGGLNHLLGRSEQAVEHLKTSFRVALEHDSDEDAAHAAGSLAAVHLHRGEHEQAAKLARQALKLLEGRADYSHEIGQSQLVLGRALLEEGKFDDADEWFQKADATFERISSISHRAGAWIARGDLAARRGDDRMAARHYRRAAEALHDVRF